MQFVYSAKYCVATWGTFDLLSQADPEAGIRIIPESPVWTMTRGCDGEVVRVRAKSFTGKVILSISQAGDLNRDLLSFLIGDALTGVGTPPMHIADAQSGEAFAIPIAWLESMPEISHQRKVGYRTWTWQCATIVPLALPGLATGFPNVKSD